MNKRLFTFYAILLIVGFFVIYTPEKTSASLGCLDYGMAYETYDGYCKCMSGYVMGTGVLGQKYCVSGDSICYDKYGYSSRYDSISGSCECSYGYMFYDDGYGTECTSYNDVCKDKYGYNAKHNSLSDKCECRSGYEFTRKSSGGLECKSCISKYGYNSSYNYLTKKCECDDDYTLKDGECVEKQNNVYFTLLEVDTNSKQAIIKSNYSGARYLIKYGIGCLSSSIKSYVNDNIVVNLGTDYYVDMWDKIVLYDDNEVCSILSVKGVDSSFTLSEKEEKTTYYYIKTPTKSCKKSTKDSMTLYYDGTDYYYDYQCKTKRDTSLEQEISKAYKDKCQQYSPNQILIYNIKIGSINKTSHISKLENKCKKEVKKEVAKIVPKAVTSKTNTKHNDIKTQSNKIATSTKKTTTSKEIDLDKKNNSMEQLDRQIGDFFKRTIDSVKGFFKKLKFW